MIYVGKYSFILLTGDVNGYSLSEQQLGSRD